MKAIPYGRRNTEYFWVGLSAFCHKYSVFRLTQFLELYGKKYTYGKQLTEYTCMTLPTRFTTFLSSHSKRCIIVFSSYLHTVLLAPSHQV